MNNVELFAGVPEEMAARLDGISDEIPPRLLASMTAPSRQECIEELVEDIEAWAGNFGPGYEEFTARRIALWLKAIALLSESSQEPLQRPATYP